VSKPKTPITEEAESKPTAELRREGRLTRIAKALASGATVTDIAEAEGIGRTLASREANSRECRQLIAEFVGDEWEEMRAVFYRSMRAIEHALSARREYLTKEGQIMHGGPDHYARLAATKHFRDFLMASRPAPKQPEPKDKMLTLQELEEILRANDVLPDPAQTH
jgi:integrase